jgi:DNA replication protein DnaC
MGVVSHNVPYGHADFGKAFPCKCQATNILKKITTTKGISTIPLHAEHMVFEDFNKTGMVEAAEIAYRIAYRQPREVPGLYLYGPTGTGKSSLAYVTMRTRFERTMRENSVLWRDYEQMIRAVQNCYADDWEGPSGDDVLNEMASVPFLVIDDFASIESKPDRTRIVLNLTNIRIANGLDTVITSNIPPHQLGGYFNDKNRIASRIEGMCELVSMEGADMRRRRKQ